MRSSLRSRGSKMTRPIILGLALASAALTLTACRIPRRQQTPPPRTTVGFACWTRGKGRGRSFVTVCRRDNDQLDDDLPGCEPRGQRNECDPDDPAGPSPRHRVRGPAELDPARREVQGRCRALGGRGAGRLRRGVGRPAPRRSSACREHRRVGSKWTTAVDC